MAILWIFISLMNIWGNLALPYSLGNKVSQQGELVGFKFNENKAMLEWSNNIETTVELETTSFEDCIYEGTFTEEQDSAILVTGCENEVRNIQIQSLLFGDIVASSFNGKVKLLTGTDHLHDIIANDIDDEPEDIKTNEFLNRTKRSYVSDPDFYDQFPYGLEDYDVQFDGDTGESDIPTSLIMNLNVYMSDSWRQKSNYNRNAKRVVAHAQKFLLHRTLDTKIVLVPRYLQYNGDHEPSRSGISSFRRDMPSPKKTISSSCNTVLSNEGATNQLLTAKKSCSKKGSCTNGIAYTPGICSCNSRTASGITSWWDPSKELVELAETFTHEIGHNLGIYHDFDTKKNKRGMTRSITCGPGKWKTGSDNQVMNYGQPRQPTWSTCSNQDFQDYYTAQKIKYNGKFCLKEKFENVGVNPNLKLWPNGIIPYRFDSSVSSSDRRGFKRVVDYFNKKLKGCVKLRSTSSSRNYVLVDSSDNGCWSYTGRQGGSQTLNIGSGQCSDAYLKPILHALGMRNEITRPDRDDYVDIHFENIRSSNKRAFTKKNYSFFNSKLPYDELSVMHYRSDAYSKNGKATITSKRGLPDEELGGRDYNKMTFLDVLKIKNMYDC